MDEAHLTIIFFSLKHKILHIQVGPGPTVLLSKRVNNYQCMFIADFSGETCMYPDLTWYPVRSMDGLSTSPVVG